jgi:TonB family protein
MARILSTTIGFLVLAVASSSTAWGQALEIAKPKEQAPKLLSAPKLEYPAELRRAEMEGIVWVNAVIDTTGRPTRMEVYQTPDPRLNQAATNFVAGSVYRPARVDGRSVAMPVRVPVKFQFRHGAF